MKNFTLSTFVLVLILSTGSKSNAQEYTFDDFVGTWHGTISSTTFSGYNDPITMTIEPDGFYTESSGHLMPTIYPNSQECEFDAPTNRFHWWYLDIVYSGQYFYQHFFYEIVYFANDTLEMHYNFWDDPEPWPEAGTIFIVKENLTPAPASLGFELYGNNVALSWDAPAGGNGIFDPDGYNVYYKQGEGAFELIDYVTETSFAHEDVTAAGWHSYHVTAVYNQDESGPSNEVSVEFTTPPPTSLEGILQDNTAVLSWVEPSAGNAAMAGLIGFNVYHKMEGGTFEFLEFVQYASYYHYDILPGIHTYHVTALYDGGESDPSNEVMVELIVSGIENRLSDELIVYPNPASEMINVRSAVPIESLRIYNHSGQLQGITRPGSTDGLLNITHLDPGLYIIRIETRDGKTIARRIFVQ